ncbi:hypothetical protein GGR58DRAFT_526785 [Xylaria digitata]|nr:hypothetical protein GGR58DRAFT_526785 [Xylaria digitata]
MYPDRDWVIDPSWNFPFDNSFHLITPGAIDCKLDFLSHGRNSYLGYLESQKYFVTWLVQAAAKQGQHVQGIDSYPFIKDTLVSFDDLIRLASAVACKGRVSQIAFICLEYMIKLRGGFDSRVEEKPNPNLADDDDCYRQNSYAMRVLRTVRDLLKSTPKDENEMIRITERYSLPPLPGEAFFAWVCFFNDLSLIRTYLKSCWQLYLESFETLTTSTLITNTAIRLIRENCKAQIEATKHLSGMQPESHIPAWICGRITGQFAQLYRFTTDQEANQSSWCCHEAYANLVICIQALKQSPNAIRLASSYDFGDFQKLMSCHTIEGQDRVGYVYMAIFILCSLLHHLRYVGWDEQDPMTLPCFDEITSDWMQWDNYLVQEKIPLCFIVSIQIFVDISLLLRRCSPTPLDDLQEHGKDKMTLFSKYLNHDTTQRRRNEDEDSISTFITIATYYAKCVKRDNVVGRLPPTLREDRLYNIDFVYHKLHPLLNGMQSWWFEQQYRSFESWAINLREAIAPAAHLYVLMRKLKLVDRWIDMECILQLRSSNILPHTYVVNKSWPDNLAIVTSLNSHFIDIGRNDPKQREYNPLGCYLADIFTCYFEHEPYHCDFRLTPKEPPSDETLHNIIDAVWPYPQMYWREAFRTNLGLEDKQLNILRILSLVRAARYLDEMLASFDLFSLHDICQRFFRQLRQLFQDKFDTFESEHPNSGLEYTPESSSDGPFSLDALYYLIFGPKAGEGAENMILASLCFILDTMRDFDLPSNRKFLCERWGDGITRHTKKLDISLESAATILGPLIKEEGSVVFKKQAETQRAHHKRRVELESWWIKYHDGWDNRNCFTSNTYNTPSPITPYKYEDD